MHNILGLGINLGGFIIILLVLYFVIKWAVKNAIEEAYENITGKETYEKIKQKETLKEIQTGLNDFNNKRKEKKKNRK